MQSQYTCPGCQKQVGQFSIKQHINNCKKYDSFTLHKMKKLNQSDDINYLKVNMIQQLVFILIISFIKIVYIISFIQKKYNNKQDDLGFEDILEEPLYKKNEMSQERGSYNKYDYNETQNKYNRMSEDPIKYRGSMIQEEVFAFDNRDVVQCAQCKKSFYASFDIERLFYVQQCWHLFCKPCIRKYIDNQFVNMGGFPKCPLGNCSNTIPQHQTKFILGDKYQSLQNKAMRKMYNIVQCCKCKSQYDFAPGNPNDAPKKDQNGKPYKAQHAILFAQNRFVCPRPDCKTQQCKQCQASPYHLGMDCKQFKSRALMMKCRYCDNPITQKNINKTAITAHTDICNSKQCQQFAKSACTKILGCSHPCSGFKGQKQCLPCLKQGCCQKQLSLNGQKGQDYCSICYIQSLTASPSLQCGCGHIFHLKCIKKRYQIKWLTPRILFNFCLCPLCKKWIQVPVQNQLHKLIQENKQLFAKIQKMASERLKFQECDKDQKLTKKDSPYYNKPNQYAMAIYAYFMCFKCQNPYFGGRKNCAEAMNEQNVQGYNPKQLVCPNCCQIPVQNCPKHGKDFIEFKCKFCCSTAQWFCWGNTHFCQPCHKKQCSGDYVSKYTKQQLPKCQGRGKCPIGGDHGQNGQQKMLGCAICRNYKQNHKGF